MTPDGDELYDLASAGVAAPLVVEQHGEQQLLVFRTGQRWFAIDPHQVHEVVVRGPITQIPTAPTHVLGITLVRGRLVPVLSLPALLAFRTDGEAAQTLPRMIVLRVEGVEVALVCDETRGILPIAGRDASDATAGRPRAVTSELRWNDKLLLVLDAGEIVTSALGTREAAT